METMSYGTEEHDTIVALSTAAGEGGIGLVRLSGDRAGAILCALYRTPSGLKRERFTPRLMTYGFAVDEGGAKIDEIMATWLAAPATYTREEMVEIGCHGGVTVTRAILERVMRLGARMARPGEFSKRAFLNGRIDLVQAEGIIDLIRSRSEKGWKTAFSQLDGRLSEAIGTLEEKLVGLLAELEASIDFPDEELEIADDRRIGGELAALAAAAERLVATYGQGRLYREGIGVAIVGRPNVGKSSLMNALLEADRVIVTDTPGATRDTVEETLHIEGVAVRIVDTAGLRETDDTAERFGVERSLKAARQADILLLLVDRSSPLTDEDRAVVQTLEKEAISADVLVVENKADLPDRLTGADRALLSTLAGTTVALSAKSGEGLDRLRSALGALMAQKGEGLGEGPVLTRERHCALLRRVAESARRGGETLTSGLSREFIAAELGDAKEALEELTGKVVDDQVVNRIFEEFCIGK
ncbi:MAG: tRNA uridine-5-carboxymethylaminomethyl(34) synthesis GTPase MnmE [Nitrospinae bacterium]|nr:tRNA uridine-5-carboxymethylaminomethyl(34) synthesis GTPase MnmE [Nitrospinota bacterium]